MNLKKLLPLLIFFGLITTPAMAEKIYIWTDQAGTLKMTNHPSFAPAHLKTDADEYPSSQALPAAAPTPPAPADTAAAPSAPAAGDASGSPEAAKTGATADKTAPDAEAPPAATQ